MGILNYLQGRLNSINHILPDSENGGTGRIIKNGERKWMGTVRHPQELPIWATWRAPVASTGGWQADRVVGTQGDHSFQTSPPARGGQPSLLAKYVVSRHLKSEEIQILR